MIPVQASTAARVSSPYSLEKKPIRAQHDAIDNPLPLRADRSTCICRVVFVGSNNIVWASQQ